MRSAAQRATATSHSAIVPNPIALLRFRAPHLPHARDVDDLHDAPRRFADVERRRWHRAFSDGRAEVRRAERTAVEEPEGNKPAVGKPSAVQALGFRVAWHN